jgi:hypothetical protein
MLNCTEFKGIAKFISSSEDMRGNTGDKFGRSVRENIKPADKTSVKYWGLTI